MYIQFEWCNPANLYDYSKAILCWTKNNRCITFKDTKNLKHWQWIVEKYGIVAWTYQFRLTPKCLFEDQELD